MRCLLFLILTLFLLPGFTAAAAKPPLTLKDEGLPLQELRPLDRKVYILTLDGTWKQPPDPGTPYYVNILFPDGQSDSHRVNEVASFRAGEVRAILQNYKLRRNGVDPGGRFDIVVSAGAPVTSADAPQVISNVIHVSWPMGRPISRFRPRTRLSELESVGAFLPPGVPPGPVPGEPGVVPGVPPPGTVQPNLPPRATPREPGAAPAPPADRVPALPRDTTRPAVPGQPIPGEPGVTPGAPPPATVQPNLPPREQALPPTPPRTEPNRPAPAPGRPVEKVPVPPKPQSNPSDRSGSQ